MNMTAEGTWNMSLSMPTYKVCQYCGCSPLYWSNATNGGGYRLYNAQGVLHSCARYTKNKNRKEEKEKTDG